jgi:hypothetical protein
MLTRKIREYPMKAWESVITRAIDENGWKRLSDKRLLFMRIKDIDT